MHPLHIHVPLTEQRSQAITFAAQRDSAIASLITSVADRALFWDRAFDLGHA
jgi:hypothetical protein